MSSKFQDKYCISSTRLQNRDYVWNAIYIVTINTHGQEHFLGEIKKGKMQLSNTGILANVLWHALSLNLSDKEDKNISNDITG